MQNDVRDDTHMTSRKYVQFLKRPFNPLVHLRPKFFNSLDLEPPISNEPPSPNDNQSFKRKHNPRMTIVCYQVLPPGRLTFSVSCLAFLWLLFSILFSVSCLAFLWLSHYLLFCNIIFFCVHLPKNTTKCLFFIIIHIVITHFAINLFFAQLESVNKLWNNNCTVNVNEQNQNKNKTKSCYIQIDHVFYCLI